MNTKQKLLSIDLGLVVALLIGTLAAWPLLVRPSLPTYNDAEAHIYRTFEILSAWRAGVPYLRWAPDFFYSYGYPIFNYFAPLTYYLAAAYGWFLGGPVAGVKFVLVASIYLGAVGMYWLVRDLWGSVPGVVAAAAYSLAPYLVYVNPEARSAVPEMLANGLSPVLLWAFLRLRRTAVSGDAVFAALAVAAVSLSHNLMSFVYIGLALAWCVWEAVLGWRWLDAADPREPDGSRQPRAVMVLGAAALVGLGLSAFMWLPAALERNAVQFQIMVLPGSHSDFRQHFVEPAELFAPARLADVAVASGGPPPYRLGLAQSLLGLLGVLAAFRIPTGKGAATFFGLAALGLIFLMLPTSIGVWNTIPLLAFIQFPWRLLGPAALALAVLAGVAVQWARSLPWRWSEVGLGGAALIAVIALALPIIDPAPWPDFGPVTLKRIFLLERDGRGLGTTGLEFLPINVKTIPAATDAEARTSDTGQVDKVDRTTLPAGTQVEALEHGPVLDRFRVTGETGFVLRVFTFYFPGWTAYVDGVRTPTAMAQPDGLITLAVPAGTHEVLLRLEDTPPRWWGWGLSGLSLAAVLGLVRWGRRSRVARPRREPLPWQQGLLLGALVLGGLGARMWADRLSWWRVPAEVQVPQAQVQKVVAFEANIALLAYDLPQTKAQPGDHVPLTLYWQARAQVPLDLRTFVHFLGPDGKLWGWSDKVSPVDYLPTSRWPFNRYMSDAHMAVLQPEAPPGVYTVRAGLWDGYTGQRMHVLDASGVVTDQDGAVLTTTFVVRP